jgi:hypothetical protein
MMQSNSDLSASLTSAGSGGGEEDSSQSSQRSGTSLLERIRAQQKAAQGTDGTERSNTVPTQQIQVPQYHPVDGTRSNMVGFGGGDEHQQHHEQGDGASSTFFQNAWGNISASMENGMASLQVHQGDEDDDVGGSGMDDALLAPTSHHEGVDQTDYSMTTYFMTFVRDVYGLFLSLPVWGRGIVVVVLLITAIKLL